jgi:thymidine kinase
LLYSNQRNLNTYYLDGEFMAHTTGKGRLEVICGSMFSGKSEELIRRLRRAQFAQLPMQTFKHNLDVRATIDSIHAHNGDSLAALAIGSGADLKNYVIENSQIIAIDEIQFFSVDIVDVIVNLVDNGKRVIVAGLDLDFRGLPFGCMPLLLALADIVTKLKAVCVICGNDAHFTQRLVNNQPAQASDSLIVIGAQECYQARCRDCYRIDKQLLCSEL